MYIINTVYFYFLVASYFFTIYVTNKVFSYRYRDIFFINLIQFTIVLFICFLYGSLLAYGNYFLDYIDFYIDKIRGLFV